MRNVHRGFRPAPCHPESRYYATDMCSSCYSKHRRETNPQYRAQVAAGRDRRRGRIRAQQRVYREVNRDKERARTARWDAAHPGRREVFRRRYEYGLTEEAYQAMVEHHAGKCAICGQVPAKGLVIDHDHATGIARGLLCRSCNTAIGLLGDDPERITLALQYLGAHR